MFEGGEFTMSKIITYDLDSPGQDYSKLIDAIKSYSDWAKISESCWVISSADSCVTIRDNLKNYIDTNDKLFVATLNGEAAWSGSISSTDDVKRVIQN
jgi:hypothetical protein